MQFSIIVFDFDGTLVLSNQLKIDAYYEVFSKYKFNNVIIEEILDSFPELNRYDTISKILLNAGLSVSLVDEVSNEYSELVFAKIVVAENLEYAEMILERLYREKTLVFLSSNTPQSILQQIIFKKQWKKYFTDVFGYPNNKVDTIRSIMKQYHLKSEDCLVVGDGLSDKISAIENSTSFFEVTSNSLRSLMDFLFNTP